VSEKVKIRKIGNSLGVILPKQTLGALRVQEGDELILTEAQDGVRLTTADPEFAKTMEVFDSLTRRYRNALRELAK
jgi:putative addiction module antidote